MNDPTLYSKSNQFQRHIVTEVVKGHLDKFQWRSQGEDTLIDIGSSTGDMLMTVICPLLARKFQRIVISDINANMVRYAQTHYQHVENSEFVEFDIGTEEKIPQRLKGQFDHVLSFYCIHMVENQIKAFENIYQLLRDDEGGDCLLNLFTGKAYYDAYLALAKMPQWSEYMGEIRKYTCYWHSAENPEKEARQMLEICGFTNIEVTLQQKFYNFLNVENFKTTMLAVSHYVHHMPRELHQAFMNDFVEALIEADENCKSLKESGAFRFHFQQLVIYARKPAARKKLNCTQ